MVLNPRRAAESAARGEFLGITVMLATLFAWMAFIQLVVYQPPLATSTLAFWGINMIPG